MRVGLRRGRVSGDAHICWGGGDAVRDDATMSVKNERDHPAWYGTSSAFGGSVPASHGGHHRHHRHGDRHDHHLNGGYDRETTTSLYDRESSASDDSNDDGGRDGDGDGDASGGMASGYDDYLRGMVDDDSEEESRIEGGTDTGEGMATDPPPPPPLPGGRNGIHYQGRRRRSYEEEEEEVEGNGGGGGSYLPHQQQHLQQQQQQQQQQQEAYHLPPPRHAVHRRQRSQQGHTDDESLKSRSYMSENGYDEEFGDGPSPLPSDEEEARFAAEREGGGAADWEGGAAADVRTIQNSMQHPAMSSSAAAAAREEEEEEVEDYAGYMDGMRDDDEDIEAMLIAGGGNGNGGRGGGDDGGAGGEGGLARGDNEDDEGGAGGGKTRGPNDASYRRLSLHRPGEEAALPLSTGRRYDMDDVDRPPRPLINDADWDRSVPRGMSTAAAAEGRGRGGLDDDEEKGRRSKSGTRSRSRRGVDEGRSVRSSRSKSSRRSRRTGADGGDRDRRSASRRRRERRAREEGLDDTSEEEEEDGRSRRSRVRSKSHTGTTRSVKSRSSRRSKDERSEAREKRRRRKKKKEREAGGGGAADGKSVKSSRSRRSHRSSKSKASATSSRRSKSSRRSRGAEGAGDRRRAEPEEDDAGASASLLADHRHRHRGNPSQFATFHSSFASSGQASQVSAASGGASTIATRDVAGASASAAAAAAAATSSASSRKAYASAAALTTCHRSEALEELGDNIRDTVDIMEDGNCSRGGRRILRAGGNGVGGSSEEERDVEKSASVDVEEEDLDGTDEQGSNPGPKLCQNVVKGFDNLLTSLVKLSDELELSSTFLSVGSITSVVSAETINAVLSHVPTMDLIFTEIKPMVMEIYDAGEDMLPSESSVVTNILLDRVGKIIGMVSGITDMARMRQEWNARSETCLVTLLELLQRTARELQCVHDGSEAEPFVVSTRLGRAWTTSGHTEELRALESAKDEDVQWLFRQLCYEVVVSTDNWCPDVTDLGVVCDCEVGQDGVGSDVHDQLSSRSVSGVEGSGQGMEPGVVGIDAIGSGLSPDGGIGVGGDVLDASDIPEAALTILSKVRGTPLPRSVTMGRVIRRILPPSATADSSIVNESFTQVRSSIRNPLGLTSETNVVAISAVPEIKDDPSALGMGGIGKSTTAAMVVSRPDVRRYFQDGVAWVRVGQRPGSEMTYEFYVSRLAELTRQLPYLEGDGHHAVEFEELMHVPGDRPTVRKRRETRFMEAAKEKVSRLLEDRRVLIVLDDVMWESDVNWFWFRPGRRSNSPIVTANTTILITTRMRNLLPAADTVEIDLLDETDAIRLLVAESDQPSDHVMSTSAEARAVVRECACHPLAVRSVGRWLSLKHATAGVLSSVEEIHEDVAKSIERIGRDGDFYSGNMMYEIMGLAFSPAVNARPTQVIKLCFSAFVVVFCHEERGSVSDPTVPSPFVPLEAADILFEKLLQLEEKALFHEGSLFYSQRKEATMLIPEALSALGVMKMSVSDASLRSSPGGPGPGGGWNGDDHHRVLFPTEQQFLQIQHDIMEEYGEYLSTPSGGMGDLVDDAERRWNRAFVMAYVETKADGGHWDDDDPDACRCYTLEFVVGHMLRGEMIEEAASLLQDESFVRGRLAVLGRTGGTRRHIRDCEALFRAVTEVGRDGTSVDPAAVMTRAYQRVGSLLSNEHDGSSDLGARKAHVIEIGRAHYAIGLSLAERRLWSQSIAHWETAQEILVSTLGMVEFIAAILFNVGVVFYEKNEYNKALTSLRHCLQIRETIHGTDHVLYAQTIQKIGDIYLGMSDYAEALDSYRTALDVMNLDPDKHRADIGNNLHNIGCIHYSRGELDDAMSRFEAALQSKKMELGENHQELAETYQRMGSCRSDSGDSADAIAMFEEAIRLKRLDFDGGDENESDILSIEGMVHNLFGRQEEGLACYEKALKILKRKVPHKMEKIAMLFHLIGCVYLIKGEHKRSMKLFEQSLQTRRKMLGFVHLDVASTLFNMAFLHQTRSKFDKALKCLEEALKIRKLRLPDSDKVALTHEKIGSIAKLVGKQKKAEVAFEEALRIRKLLHGDDHESVASVLHEMGDLMDDIGEFDEAVTCFSDALDIRRRKLGGDHEDVAATLYSMGFTLHNKDLIDRALLCFEESLNIRRARLGEEAKEVGDTLNMMGFLNAKLGEFDRALTFLWDALRIRKLNEDYVKASDTLKNIGNVHREKPEYELAIECYEECLRIRRKELGDDHEKVADALIALGNIRSDMEEHHGAMICYQEALTIRILCHGDTDERVAAVLQNMGIMEFRAGDLTKGKQFLEEYMRIRRLNNARADADFVNVLFIIGNINKIQGDDSGAQKNWKEAYDIFNEIGLAEENPKIGQVMNNLLRGIGTDDKDHKKGLFGRLSLSLGYETAEKGVEKKKAGRS